MLQLFAVACEVPTRTSSVTSSWQVRDPESFVFCGEYQVQPTLSEYSPVLQSAGSEMFCKRRLWSPSLG
jgi:hypothetical protein